MRAPGARHDPVVLLVQPERDDRDMYVEGLRYEGFTVLPVSTAHEALIAAPQVAVIVTGILLPGHMDGLELVGRLRKDERTKSLPVVVLTACAWDAERERAHAAGCDLFLTKPCSPHALVTQIGRLLAMRRVPRPNPARARLVTMLRRGSNS
jgi:CheY-like chemotaxis protein